MISGARRPAAGPISAAEMEKIRARYLLRRIRLVSRFSTAASGDSVPPKPTTAKPPPAPPAPAPGRPRCGQTSPATIKARSRPSASQPQGDAHETSRRPQGAAKTASRASHRDGGCRHEESAPAGREGASQPGGPRQPMQHAGTEADLGDRGPGGSWPCTGRQGAPPEHQAHPRARPLPAAKPARAADRTRMEDDEPPRRRFPRLPSIILMIVLLEAALRCIQAVNSTTCSLASFGSKQGGRQRPWSPLHPCRKRAADFPPIPARSISSSSSTAGNC